jgi:hypothetical protein
MKIVSGGQTGIDRAALDVAMKHQMQCGGWCPVGRLDEYGRIPDRYPVKELPSGGSAERTAANVRDSDATVIFHCGEIRGGTEYTTQCCGEYKRPRLLLDAQIIAPQEAGKLISYFVDTLKIHTLNVAGPRQSEWSGGYDYASAALDKFVDRSEAKRL